MSSRCVFVCLLILYIYILLRLFVKFETYCCLCKFVEVVCVEDVAPACSIMLVRYGRVIGTSSRLWV